MQHHIQEFIDKVKLVIGARAFTKMVTFAAKEKPSLWGEQKPSDHLKHMVAMTVYKDIKGVGYKTLNAKVDFDYLVNHKSLQHNIQLL
jgi:hypothetical protein